MKTDKEWALLAIQEMAGFSELPPESMIERVVRVILAAQREARLEARANSPFIGGTDATPDACPFCGGTNFTVRRVDECDEQAWLGAYVHCCHCSANVYGLPTVKQAVATWNNRVRPKAL